MWSPSSSARAPRIEARAHLPQVPLVRQYRDQRGNYSLLLYVATSKNDFQRMEVVFPFGSVAFQIGSGAITSQSTQVCALSGQPCTARLLIGTHLTTSKPNFKEKSQLATQPLIMCLADGSNGKEPLFTGLEGIHKRSVGHPITCFSLHKSLYKINWVCQVLFG